MTLWYRIFAATDTLPEPAGIQTCLAGSGAVVSSDFAADATGWYHAEISIGQGEPLILERWLADEEGIRGELNSWAGFLETLGSSSEHQSLMERTIQAQQLFTLKRSDDQIDETLCVTLCQYLARLTDGFYQIDDVGFFAADGTLLVAEGP